jgi:hypothetical protein
MSLLAQTTWFNASVAISFIVAMTETGNGIPLLWRPKLHTVDQRGD